MAIMRGSILNQGVSDLARWINAHAHPLENRPQDFDPLMDIIGDARIVLLGEDTHGSTEFYRDRARISQRLIAEKGFNLLACEGDWPEFWRVSEYLLGGPGTAEDAMATFQVYPTWMWGNREVLSFVKWLRAYNDEHQTRIGWYGLDLYSIQRSIEAVVRYLDRVHPVASTVARRRYECIWPYIHNIQLYGYQSTLGMGDTCEREMRGMLSELEEHHDRYMECDPSGYLNALHSARVAIGAEEFYRAMFRGSDESWNVRDRHMAATLEQLLEWMGPDSKAIVWAHNTHVGDARATSMADQGELNLGQLCRERFGDAVRLVGFSTYRGTVTGSDTWGGEPTFKPVPAAAEGSFEDAFHQAGIPKFVLGLREFTQPGREDGICIPRRERAIGVVYNPEWERVANYITARLPDQFDAMLFYDNTFAVEPIPEHVDVHERPQTYPFGL